MNDKTHCKDDERLGTLLGLAATKTEPMDECPPPELLNAFINESLPKTRRQRFLSHLNQCDSCYQEWLTLSLALEEARPEDSSVRERAPSWWQRVREFFRFRSWLPPLTTAVALSLIVMAVIVYMPSEQPLPASELVALVKGRPGIERALEQLPRSSSAPFAFSDTRRDPSKQAFTMGFNEVLAHFDQSSMAVYREQTQETSDSWQDNLLRDYYQLGQWMLLTLLLAQSDEIDTETWQTFDRYCISFIDRFEKSSRDPAAERTLTSLREIHNLLHRLSQRPDPIQQARLARKLKLTIQQWLV